MFAVSPLQALICSVMRVPVGEKNPGTSHVDKMRFLEGTSFDAVSLFPTFESRDWRKILARVHRSNAASHL